MTESEIESIKKFLLKQETLYHESGASEVSDDIYDGLCRMIGRTPRGAPISEIDEASKHDTPMLGLDNIITSMHDKAVDQLAFESWVKNTIKKHPNLSDKLYVAEPKLDGVAMRLNYVSGLLVEAATRGDKTVGRNITVLVLESGLAPMELCEPLTIEVRGEINIPEVEFRTFNNILATTTERTYATARNATAGWLSSNNSAYLQKLAQFTAYDVLGLSSDHIKNKATLDGLGFAVAKSLTTFTLNHPEAAIACFEQAMATRNGSKTDCIWDGIVYKLNDHRDRDYTMRDSSDASLVSSGFPPWAIAHKFPPAEDTTQLTGINYSVGNDGRITPVAKLNQVTLGGVSITAASLGSVAKMETMDIGIGDTVVLCRSCDVIPKVTSVLFRKAGRPSVTDALPRECPACSTALVRQGKHLFCPNHDRCPAQEVGRLLKFTGLHGFDIDGLSTSRLEKLKDISLFVDEGIAGFYRPDFKAMCTLALGSKVVADAIDAKLQAVKSTVSFSSYLYSFAVNKLGTSLSNELASAFSSFDELYSATADEVASKTNIKAAKWKEIAKDLFSQANLRTHELLKERGVTPVATSTADAKWAVTFTGTVTISRKEMTKLANNVGVRVNNNVSAKNTALVAGSNPNTAKLVAAKKHSIPVWTEEDFKQFLYKLK